MCGVEVGEARQHDGRDRLADRAAELLELRERLRGEQQLRGGHAPVLREQQQPFDEPLQQRTLGLLKAGEGPQDRGEALDIGHSRAAQHASEPHHHLAKPRHLRERLALRCGEYQRRARERMQPDAEHADRQAFIVGLEQPRDLVRACLREEDFVQVVGRRHALRRAVVWSR